MMQIVYIVGTPVSGEHFIFALGYREFGRKRTIENRRAIYNHNAFLK